jgi:hypothetical protein
MPDMWRLSFQWKHNSETDSSGNPVTRKLAFVASEEDAIPQMNAAISNDVLPTLGESLTINATRQGSLRGNPGTPG